MRPATAGPRPSRSPSRTPSRPCPPAGRWGHRRGRPRPARSFANGMYTIDAGGTNSGRATDGFGWVYRCWTGDGDLSFGSRR